MEILPKLTRFRINGLQISSFYTLDNVLDKETENIFQTPQGTVELMLFNVIFEFLFEKLINQVQLFMLKDLVKIP